MSATPKTLTTQETDRLLNFYADRDYTARQKLLALRNKTMLLFMLDAGLRVGEVVKLKRNMLITDSDPVTTLCVDASITKSKRDRFIPLTERLQKQICLMHKQLWITIHHHAPRFAFYCLNNNNPVTTRQVERIVTLAAVVMLGRRIHPHMLRHTFASRLMRTTNARIVQELLGHKNIESTQIYTHPNSDDLTKAIKSLG